MRRRLSARIAALLLVGSLAMPAFAARRNDDPGIIGSVDRLISHIVKVIRNIVPLDDISATPPKP